MDEALAYLPYVEVMATPPGALRARLSALERRRFTERAEVLEDLAMVGEISWGQAVQGKMPASILPYKFVDTPFRRYLHQLARLGAGLPLGELPEEQAERLKVENAQLRKALLN